MSHTSYANEDSLLRAFNLVDFIMPTVQYKTPYIDVSKYSSFNIVGNSNFPPISFELYHSTNGSGDTTKEIVEVTPVFNTTNVLFDFGTYLIQSRYLSINILGVGGANINLQCIFSKSSLGLGNLMNTGSGVPIYNAPDSIKTLTSNDGSVIITDNVTEIDFSTSGNSGIVTVGTVGADYPTIEEAVTALNCNIRVITDVVETLPVSLASCPHLRVQLNPGVTLSNTIAGSGDWFTGNNTLLNMVGAGAHINNTTPGLSSRIILQAGQSFRSGSDAELKTEGIRYSGNGSNTLTSGSSIIENCRFDNANSFNINNTDDNLYINNCYFESDINIESPGLLPSSGVLITNNNFEGHSLNIQSSSLSFSNITDNIFTGGAFGLSVSNSSSDIIVSNNTMEPLLFSGTIDCSTISNNTCTTATFNGAITDSTVAGNTTTSLLFGSSIGGVGSSVTITGNTCDGGITVVGAVTSMVFQGNTSRPGGINFNSNVNFSSINSNYIDGGGVGDDLTFSGSLNTSTCNDNIVSNPRFIVFLGSLTNTDVSGNVAGSMQFSGLVGATAQPVPITNNACSSTITFFSTLSRFTFTGNQSAVVIFTGALDKGTVSSNTVGYFQFLSTLTQITMVGNFMDSGGPGGNSLDITGLCSQVSISNNVITGNVTFGAGITAGNFSNNDVTGGIAITLGLLNASVDNNKTLNITVSQECDRASISGNTVLVGGIALDTTDNGETIYTRVNSNFCNGSVSIGSSGGTGIIGNTINSNIILVGISTVLSNLTNNVVTGNSCSSVVGFGGTDVVANNV